MIVNVHIFYAQLYAIFKHTYNTCYPPSTELNIDVDFKYLEIFDSIAFREKGGGCSYKITGKKVQDT